MSTSVHDISPVLIVGAGPTGLTLGNILARYGIPVRVVEKKPRLSIHTKATNIMQRTQELLSSIGLTDPLTEIGGQMSRMMIHAYGGNFGPRTMHLNDTPFPNVILCGQHNFEAIAAAGLAAQGVAVEFGSELIALTQTDGGVTAEIRVDGSVERADFSYVVGTDGHAGITRTFTRLNFQTKKTGVAIRQLDCRLTWHRLSTMDQMWLFYFEHGFAVVVPLPGGVHRVLIIEPKDAMPNREPTLAEMQEKLRTVADDPDLTLTDPEWFSYTDLSMGIAPGLIDGRIILAGDVGNPVLPNGGQGMNTGIADAFNLGWKLAAVLRHRAPEALLKTYDSERHALRTALEKAQFASLKYTTLVTPKAVQAAFRGLAETVLNLGAEYKTAEAFSELKINTRKSPLTVPTKTPGGMKAGDRALDSQTVQGFESIHLFDLLYRGGWTLLAFTGRRPSASTRVLLGRTERLSTRVSTYVITTDSTPIPSSDEQGRILFDLDGEAHRIYGVNTPTLVLVRPDGHLAIRVSLDGGADIDSYLDTWAPDATQQFASTRSDIEFAQVE